MLKTTISVLLSILGLSFNAIAQDNIKGPPDAGINMLKVVSNSDTIYANNMMQASVIVLYDIDPAYQVKRLDLYELYTKRPLELQGITISQKQNTVDGRLIPTNIGHVKNNITNKPSDKGTSFQEFFLSSDRIIKIKVCAELELTNGSIKNTCDGTTNQAFVPLSYIAPMTYGASEFSLIEIGSGLARYTSPGWKIYNMVRNDGRTDFYYEDRDNNNDRKLDYDDLNYYLSWRNAFVVDRENNGGTWSNSVFVFKPDVPFFQTRLIYVDDLSLHMAVEVPLAPDTGKILTVVGVNMLFNWEFALYDGKKMVCQGRYYNSYRCALQSTALPPYFAGDYGTAIPRINPVQKSRTMVLRDSFGNKTSLFWRIGNVADAYFNEQHIEFKQPQ
jgi:hypothetical protein